MTAETLTENQALEVRAEQDKFLALIEKVIVNKDVEADKLRVLVDLQIQLEDRQAEKAFDADMIAAQSEVRALAWDKLNTERNSRNVSYPKIDKMLRPIRQKYGFTQTWDSEPSAVADMMVVCCDVIHRGGHRRRYRLPMPIDNMGPKGGSGVMTKQQAVVSGSSYGIRKLASMIWDIPLLVDKDDYDGNPIHPQINEEEIAYLEEKTRGWSKERMQWLLKGFNVERFEDLPRKKYKEVTDRLELALTQDQKRAKEANGQSVAPHDAPHDAKISDIKVVDLQAKIEEIGGSCKAEFLKAHGIKRIGDLPERLYKPALEWLEQQRRK